MAIDNSVSRRLVSFAPGKGRLVPRARTENFDAPGFDDSSWSLVPVPGSWQLDVPPVPARSSHELTVDESVVTASPADGELVLSVRAKLAKDHNGLPAGHEIGCAQLVLQAAETPAVAPAVRGEDHVAVSLAAG